MPDAYVIGGMGWLPDYPSDRDLTPETSEVTTKAKKAGEKRAVKDLLEAAGAAPGSRARGTAPESRARATAKESKPKRGKVKSAPKGGIPTSQNLREWCSPIENQGNLGSCTANAACGAIEYFERKKFGKHVDGSRLFVYKATRNLLHWTGDQGAFLRSTMGALTLFGVPPEEYWPYDVSEYDVEPPAFCYSFAQAFQATQYFRHDPPGRDRDAVLDGVRHSLAAGIPVMFGFSVYDSIREANEGDGNGRIPFPSKSASQSGGHAVLAVGYDDALEIKGKTGDAPKTTGAFTIRNSWGAAWGDDGYGYLPYDYLTEGLAVDWWTILKSEWIDTDPFKE